MAQDLSGNPDAGKILDQLYRARYFVDRRAELGLTYQYQDLFREFLLHRVQEVFPAEERLRLQREAARLLEASGAAEDALALRRETADWREGVRLILAQAPAWLAQGRRQTLSDWIAQVPQEWLNAEPWLLYWSGMARLPIDPARARETLQAVFDRFAEQGETFGQISSACGVVEAHFFEYADYAPLDRWISALETLLGGSFSFPSPQSELRALSCMLVAALYRQPQHPSLAIYAARVRKMLDAITEPNQRIAAATFLLNYYSWMGTFDQAKQLIAWIARELDHPELTPLNQVWFRVRSAYCLGLLAEHDSAVAELGRATQVAQANELRFIEVVIDLYRALNALSQGDVKAVEALLPRIEAALNPSRLMGISLYHLIRCWLASLKGELTLALQEGERAAAIAHETGAVTIEGIRLIGLAQVRAERGEPEAAAEAVAAARALLAGMKSPLVDYHISLIEADAALKTGKRCRSLMSSALGLARQHGFANTFAWLPAMMARIAACALEQGIEAEYVTRLVRQRGLVPENPEVESWPWPIRVYTLKRFAVVKNGAAVSFSGKAQRKPLELLKALIALGGRDVSNARLLDLLWPDSQGDAGVKAIEAALHRLRKLLECDQAVRSREGKLTLDPHYCWVDVWALERLLNRFEALERKPGNEFELEEVALGVFRLYHGHFLAQEDEAPWMLALRERLRGRFVRHVLALGRRREQTERWSSAAELYERALELDNLNEELYRRLMLCQKTLGHYAEALEVYRRCRRMLSVVLGVKPSAETEEIRQSLS